MNSDLYERMKVLNVADETAPDVRNAYERFNAGTAGRNTASHWQFTLPRWSVATAALAVVLLAVYPVRSLGQKFLQMLRIQKLAVMPIGDWALLQSNGSNSSGRLMTQLISDNVLFTVKPGPPLTVPDLQEARSHLSFAPESLNALGNPTRIQLQDQGALQMTLDADKIRAVLNEAGRSDIQIPDSITGSVIAVHLSKGIDVQYGNCTDHSDETCLHFMQVPVPDISLPANLDMTALAESVLQMTGLSAADAARVAKSIDWSSTLVIPVPENQATYQTVPVDGVAGTLIQWTAKRTGSEAYELVWVKNGIVHSAAGRGGRGRVLAAAASLGQ